MKGADKTTCCICHKVRKQDAMIETTRGYACRKHPGLWLVLPWPAEYYDREELADLAGIPKHIVAKAKVTP